MPFLLLLLLTVACLPVKWPSPPVWVKSFGDLVLRALGAPASGEAGGPVWDALVGSALLTWLAVTLVVGAAALHAWHMRRRLTRHPQARNALLHRHAAWRFYHLVSLFAFYGVALYILGWGWVAQGASPGDGGEPDPLPGAELFILAPFLVALVTSWAFFYDAERAMHDAVCGASGAAVPYWSRGAYLLFHIRQNLALVFIPVLLLITVQGLPRLLPQIQEGGQIASVATTLIAAVTVFICMPWVIRLVLGLKPMPEGALRTRLMGAAKRLHFRCSNVLVWNTRGGVANAMVVGILPWLRYVVLTDRLISEMTPAEAEAVFGHEVGHIKHRHMVYYLAFLLVSLAVLSEIWELANLESILDLSSRKDLAILPVVASLGAYIFLVFGFVSRRCERQADIYGCRAVSCASPDCRGHDENVALLPGGQGLCPTGIHTFIGALEKVACLNGISRDRPGWLQSWQHSTIARRVDFLQGVLLDPGAEPRFQRRVGLVKWVLFLGLGAVLVFLGATYGWDKISPF
jgi:STE24 endopeptidase